ncbi:MAG: DUF2079 domain-containing protein [Phycisphaerales bacterium]|nr:MAG: DUF2079 domain-containing protein [Phycisphaerales bacterium]
MTVNTSEHALDDARARRLLALMIALYALLGAAFGYYRCWYVYRSSCDSAMLSQIIWATAKGHGLLYSPIWAENYLAQNFCPLVLVLTPVFWVLSSPVAAFIVLLFCQSLAIGLCAWPAYLIARRRIEDNTACLLLALVTLLYPTVLSQNFFQFIPHVLGLPFILAALYFYEARAFWRFALCCALAVTGKETFAFAVFMFFPVTLFHRRGWKWSLFPLAFSVGFLALYFLWISPHFRGDHPMHSGIYLAYLGDSPGEILRSLCTEPQTLGPVVFAPRKLVYPFLLLAPLALFVPLLGWPALLCLPDFCVNMISNSESFTLIGHHYGTVIGVFLCAAAIHGVGRLSRRLTERWNGRRSALLLSLGLLATCVAASSSAFRLSEWDPLPHRQTLTRAIEMIPPDASVMCSQNLLVHFIYRLNACDDTMLKWRFEPADQFPALTRFDYVVFDLSPPFSWSQQIQEWASRVMAHPAYRTLLYEDWTLVLERREKGLMDDFWKGNPEF